jgi:hypothetical protein
MAELPSDYEADSAVSGAMRRRRGALQSPARLMWLLLVHLVHGSTLAETAALASASGLGAISAVAVMKRLMNSNAWFKLVISKMAPRIVAPYLAPEGLEGYRVLAVDASDVASGVSNFAKKWHLHFALDLLTLSASQWKITDEHTGETLRNFDFAAGDLVLADRVYGTFAGMSHCLSQGADFIVRLRSEAFIVRDEDGRRIDLLARLREAPDNTAVDIPVWVDMDRSGAPVRLRVCAIRKSEEAMLAAWDRMRKRDAKNQRKRSRWAMEFNGFIVVCTSLPDSVPARQVLGAYRYRWQVENHFKRLKSLLAMGEIPKKQDRCMEAWLNGKMLLALLIEVRLSKADFSPLA